MHCAHLVDQPQSPEILVLPAGVADHRSQRSNRKRIAQLVVGHDNPPAVQMPINPMASAHPLQNKTVFLKRAHELTRGDATGRLRHTLTATAGSGSSTVPCWASTGTFSPASMRSWTYSATASRAFARASS